VTRYGQAGSSPLGSILGLLFGGGAALVVAALFMTGLAQRQIVPWARSRAEQAVARATSAVKPGSKTSETLASDGTGGAGPAGSASPTGGASPAGVAASPADSVAAQGFTLQALSAQIETQKTFLAQREAELTRMRAGIDSLHQASSGIDDAERKRQAKLLSAMKPDEAARVLGQMDDATLAVLLDAMNAKAAAKVMARMDPARMAKLTTRAVFKGEMTGVIAPNGQEAGPASR
jgi:flagellar motility protein MotE (MotC chaperone)